MSQPVLLKVYAALTPAGEELFEACTAAASGAIAMEGDFGPFVFLEDHLLRISFEGIYFPWEDMIPLLERAVASGARGKMDVLDMENWTMTRLESRQDRSGAFGLHQSTVSLNHVLDYSGL